MRILILYVMTILSFSSCKAQEKMALRYLGYQYNTTANNSFINQQLKFIKGIDTIRINVRLPYDPVRHQIIDRGIYYNCHLKKDTVYTVTIKKICINDMRDVPNSYYKINAIPNENDCSKFTEVKKDTEYKYEGNYGHYIDINNVLYEIINLTPDKDCFFPP